MAEKIFIGRVEVKETEYGEIIKLAFNPEDKKKLEQYSNNSGWTNISIMTSRNGGRYATIDTYSLNASQVKPKVEPLKNNDIIDVNEVPF